MTSQEDCADQEEGWRVVGNRIVIQPAAEQLTKNDQHLTAERKELPAVAESQRGNHLKDNWLVYWEHRIGLPDSDRSVHFNHIALQSYAGHSAAVRSIATSECEDWFVTASRDKTVKIWSLAHAATSSTSDVTAATDHVFAYKQHKKSVNDVILVDQSVLSCDGSVHVWDPFTGQQTCYFDAADLKSSVVAVCARPCPAHTCILALADNTARVVDLRMKLVAQQYKITFDPSVGVVRCMCACADWFATGFTSGFVSTIDFRSGPINRMWKAHGDEVTSSARVTSRRLVTSSLDSTLTLWDMTATAPAPLVYRSLNDPAHQIVRYEDEMVCALPGNRLAVLPLPADDLPPESLTSSRAGLDKPRVNTKLRSDVVRGNVTSLAVLPMKRQLLVCTDAGCIKHFA